MKFFVSTQKNFQPDFLMDYDFIIVFIQSFNFMDYTIVSDLERCKTYLYLGKKYETAVC